MIEAMACGTPVVAWDRGSVPEVIEDGVSGRVVRTLDEAVAAVAEVAAFDRGRVRDAFERRFTARAMARRYLALYEKLGPSRLRDAALVGT
jgi:glycosyltransferase involved in cell wall biosynthesis